jgi:hypothetical protein
MTKPVTDEMELMEAAARQRFYDAVKSIVDSAEASILSGNSNDSTKAYARWLQQELTSYARLFSLYPRLSEQMDRIDRLDEAIRLVITCYRLGRCGISRPVLERLLHEKGQKQTENAREAKLQTHSGETETKTRISVSCAEQFLKNKPPKQFTMNGLVTRILTEIEKKCKSTGVDAPKRGSVTMYLNACPDIVSLVLRFPGRGKNRR